MNATGKRVLIVEDDRFLRRACQARLEQQGYTILTAQDGEEAIRIARTNVPDLILLDLLMPKMNGLDVLRILRAEESTRAVPVLVLSNSSRQEDVETIRTLGGELAAEAEAVLVARDAASGRSRPLAAHERERLEPLVV